MAQPATSYIPQTDADAAERLTRTVQRTDGADTVEEWLQAISEPFLPSYRVITAAVALSTANEHLIQIMAGSTLRVGIRRIQVLQAANATSTGVDAFSLYRLTSAGTGGTSYTPAPLDPADSASGATAMTLPTAKGTEDTLIDTTLGLVHATVATVGLTPLFTFDFTTDRTKALWIAAGTSNGIAIKNLVADAAATVRIRAELVESSWT
jgi:hypothetical protein